MKVVYKPIMLEMDEAIEDAKRNNRRIIWFEITSQEHIELRTLLAHYLFYATNGKDEYRGIPFKVVR